MHSCSDMWKPENWLLGPRMTNLLYQKLGRLAAALVLVCAIAGCSEWPPNAEKLSNKYFEHRAEFMELSRLTQSTKYKQIFRSRMSGGVRISVPKNGGRTIEFIAGPIENSINKLFGELNLVAAIRIQDRFQLETENISSEGKMYYVYYLYGRSADGSPECSGRRKSYESGMCRLPLDSDWSVIYKW